MAFNRFWWIPGACVLLLACGDDSAVNPTTSSSTGPSDTSTTAIDTATSVVTPGTTEDPGTSSGDTTGPEPTTTAVDSSSTGPTPMCGNDVTEEGETCDGNDVGGLSCADIEGFESGDLFCLDDCSDYDTSQCFTGVCGNGNLETGEVCDQNDLGGVTCADIEGFDSGQLGCLLNCSDFDTSECGVCGNVIVDGDEVCDDIVFLGETCETQGFETGTLTCAPDCLSLDTSTCGICGNDMTDGDDVCDGADLNGETCASLGLVGGTLTCVPECTAYDTSMCDIGCGNNMIDGIDVCDGTDLGGETCITQGFPTGGNLSCLPDCSAFDLSMCGCSGDCCVAHPTPGCEDPTCEAAVCGGDPFCCSIEWDGICEGDALANPACNCPC